MFSGLIPGGVCIKIPAVSAQNSQIKFFYLSLRRPNRGFLRSDKPIGTALVKLDKLETQSEIREIVEVSGQTDRETERLVLSCGLTRVPVPSLCR